MSEKDRILNNVLDALQDAEEMGGVSSDQEYIELMQAVSETCQQRIEACREAMPANQQRQDRRKTLRERGKHQDNGPGI